VTVAQTDLVGEASHGVSLRGTAELSVRGRTSGEWRRIPLSPLPYEGGPYLISARGHSQWVRNLRAAGGGQLQVGRRTQQFTAVELIDEEKPVLLRTYLRGWVTRRVAQPRPHARDLRPGPRDQDP
jgi:deazaflavin-dependent oxidoreductase (nitroreductase family)